MSRDKQKIVRVPEKSRVKRDRIAPKTKVFEQRDKLIAEYYEYVDVVVLRLMREMHLPPQMKEEFVSAGLFGLIEAAGRFKPERGQQFKTFAFLRIRGAVIDYIRQSCDLSGYAYRRLKSLEAAQQLREDRLEEKEAASARDVDTFEQSVGCLEKTAIIFRLTRQAGSEDASATDQESQNPERSLENRRTAKKIREIVATLPEKERIIVEQYYFHDRKLVDVAEQFAGLSKSWVSRLHDRAIEMLREKIAATVPELAA
jgi:RNA polymerase sigma factor for flagellar operon FliA